MTDRFILAGVASFRQEIKKSRFLAQAAPIADEGEAREFLAQHSDPSANHNCWAWRIGQSYRFSDDGEPSGTAGKPILQAIDGQGLDRTVVVVTRWFGGVLLGSGGLIRAYGGTAASCLREAPKLPLVELETISIQSGFSDAPLLRARLEALPGVSMSGQEFLAEGVVQHFRLPAEMAEKVRAVAADVTSGRALILGDD